MSDSYLVILYLYARFAALRVEDSVVVLVLVDLLCNVTRAQVKDF